MARERGQHELTQAARREQPVLPPAEPTLVSAPALTAAEARERDIERRLAFNARQRRLAEGARFRAAGKLKAARKAKPRPAGTLGGRSALPLPENSVKCA
ncbi:hypothetical protein GCM10010103_57420 [Streptomyces paradoxus]